MLNDQRTSYRWQDHVIAPQRTTLNLLATVLIVAVVGAAAYAAGHDPVSVAHAPITTEQASSLAQIVKRPASQHVRFERFGGC
jgi:hypothetical protein